MKHPKKSADARDCDARKLLVDLGNSRVKFAFVEPKNIRQNHRQKPLGALTVATAIFKRPSRNEKNAARASTAAKRELAAFLRAANRENNLTAFVASVVPAVNFSLTQTLRRAGISAPIFITPNSRQIIEHQLTNAETVGVDRLLAARAARQIFGKHSKNLAIIHAGTALVADLVTRDGVFRGGLIMPGLPLLCRAFGGAAQLPRLPAAHFMREISRARGKIGVGRDSESAVAKGGAAALIGAVREAIAQIRQTAHKLNGGRKTHSNNDRDFSPLKIILTGGYAREIAKQMPSAFAAEICDDLVIRGLADLTAAARLSE